MSQASRSKQCEKHPDTATTHNPALGISQKVEGETLEALVPSCCCPWRRRHEASPKQRELALSKVAGTTVQGEDTSQL